jgi:hypothetical protein
MNNIYFFGVTYGQEFDDNPADLTASNFELTLPSDTLEINDFFKKGTDAFVTEVDLGSNSVGADKTKFSNWSWAAVAGALTDF